MFYKTVPIIPKSVPSRSPNRSLQSAGANPPDSVPPIINVELKEKVNQFMNSRKWKPSHRKAKICYLLSDKIICRLLGSGITAKETLIEKINGATGRKEALEAELNRTKMLNEQTEIDESKILSTLQAKKHLLFSDDDEEKKLVIQEFADSVTINCDEIDEFKLTLGVRVIALEAKLHQQNSDSLHLVHVLQYYTIDFLPYKNNSPSIGREINAASN